MLNISNLWTKENSLWWSFFWWWETIGEWVMSSSLRVQSSVTKIHLKWWMSSGHMDNMIVTILEHVNNNPIVYYSCVKYKGYAPYCDWPLRSSHFSMDKKQWENKIINLITTKVSYTMMNKNLYQTQCWGWGPNDTKCGRDTTQSSVMLIIFIWRIMILLFLFSMLII
jgi:hypothetical protein